MMQKVIIWLLIGAFALSSCSPAIQPAPDFGIISQEPCGPPCFQGITPGVTTEKQAARILRGICRSWGISMEHFDRGGSDVGGFITDSCGRIRVDSATRANGKPWNKVWGIHLQPSDLTVGQVIEKYGPPDGIQVDDFSSPPDAGGRGMAIFYRKLSALFFLAAQPENVAYTVTPNSAVRMVQYGGGFGELTRPWEGYKSYP